MPQTDPPIEISMTAPSAQGESGDAISKEGHKSFFQGFWQRFRQRSPSSAALQLCLVLSAFCLLAIVFPGHLDSADAVQPELRHYVAKVASFLSSNEKPQIVILGSSLMLYPATLCDLEMEGKKPLDNDWYAAIFMPEYKYAKYFQKLLSTECHVNCQITNLAVASSLMSDHCLLLEAIAAADKSPKLIVCGIAPRDFVDNNQPDLASTPVHKLLSDIRPELFLPNKSPLPEAGFLDRQGLQIRRAISCLRASANYYFCLFTNRPENDNDGKMVKGVVQFPPSKDKDLTIYKRVYNPVNQARFGQQSGYLDRMLSDAKRKNIRVVLVSMPLTADNADLLPGAALAKYNQTIKDLSAKYQNTLLDLQRSPEFDAADFIDSCHLNARGGAKFYTQLVKAIHDSKADAALSHN